MTLSHTVRLAQTSDAEAIAEIYAEHVRTGTASFDTVPRTIFKTADNIALIQQNGWPFLVVETEERVHGYAYVTQFRDRPSYASTCENSVYVRAGYMGRGLGKILLKSLIDRAQAVGFRQMIAVIGGNNPASVALHEQFGFVHSGTMRSVGRKFGVWLDTNYMQLRLGAGDTTPPLVEPQ